ncbi:MAG: alpha/beta fold hydrolase [Chloroflexota bacterium]
MTKRVFIFLMTAMVLAFASLAVPAAAQDSTVPRFEKGDCPFDIPSGQTPTCGYLIVPEDRTNPTDTTTIKIAAAVFKSTGSNPQPDPMIYLDGGPGGSTLKSISQSFDSLFAPFINDRDVIAFDQRGVGLSQPALDCQELTDLTYQTLAERITIDESVNLATNAITACGTRLRDAGANLAAYNSAQSAADVNDLRQALGYKQLDLLGISYGTRLALTIMRDFPDAVHSSIIDSVVPLQADKFEDAQSADHAFNTLFDACAKDTNCNTAYPNLKQVFYETAKQLDANPGSVTIPDLRNRGKTLDAVIDGTGFLGLTFQAMYIQELLGQLPKAIYKAHDGDLSGFTLVLVAELSQLDQISQGMFYAVNCNEEFAFDTKDMVQTILKNTPPELVGFARNALIDPVQLSICKSLGAETPDPKENQPVVSDIPTLVLSGEFDPITPLSYAKEAAATLSNSRLYTFPGLTHGVTPSNDCTKGIANAFFNDPSVALDTSCIASLPEVAFVTPNSAVVVADVNLVPFSDDQFGFTSLKPEGWKDIQVGTVARQQTMNDAAALIQISVPHVTTDQLVGLLATQFGLKETPQSTGTREANGLTWTLFQMEVMGVPSDLAVAESDTTTYMIQMTSSAEEHDSLYEKVFLPVIDSLTPLA